MLKATQAERDANDPINEGNYNGVQTVGRELQDANDPINEGNYNIVVLVVFINLDANDPINEGNYNRHKSGSR